METDLPTTSTHTNFNAKPRDPKRPAQCVGIVCFRGEEVLLIQRGTAPRKGEWSIPGGHIEPGETQESAALRELFEETSIRATLGPKIEVIDAVFEDKAYILHDFVALWESGNPQAGDDAKHAEFVLPARLDSLGMWPKTREVIETARAALPALRRTTVDAPVQLDRNEI